MQNKNHPYIVNTTRGADEMKKVFLPAIALMGRLKYGQKFILISVLFLLPIILLVYVWLNNQLEQSKLLKRELEGSASIQEVYPLVLSLQSHRGLMNGYKNGDQSGIDQIEINRQAIEDTLSRLLETMDQEVYPQSIKKLENVQQEWSSFIEQIDKVGAPESFNKHTAFVNEALQSIKYMADESNMSLDSNINTYYMITMLTKDLPELSETIAVIRGKGNGILAKGEALPQELADINAMMNTYTSIMNGLDASLARFTELYEKSDQNSELTTIINEAVLAAKLFGDMTKDQVVSTTHFTMRASDYFLEGTQTIAQITNAIQAIDQSLVAGLEERQRILYTSILLCVALLLILLIIIIWLYVGFYKSVMGTVKQLEAAATAMAKGDLTQDIHLSIKDELLQVGTSMNAMREAIGDIVKDNQHVSQQTFIAAEQLKSIAEETTAAMKQVTASVQVVSDGNSGQSKAISEANIAMNEMATGVQRIAEAASEISFAAQSTTQHAELGGQQLNDTLEQIKLIKQTQENSVAVVNALASQSQEINKVIKVIMNVAAQTKLLALNANIEAARAGEAGKGFAVVAYEVGLLAEQTTSSGHDISARLGEILRLVENNVMAMESMSEETEKGLQSIYVTKHTVDRIVEEVKIATEQIQEVSATSQQMSAEMEEVTATLTEIDHISNRNSSEAENMAAAAEEQLASMEQIDAAAQQLSQLAKQLDEQLKAFKL